MTHEKIKRRQITGQINDDKDIPRLRRHYQHLLENSMRDEGLAPLLDVSPAFSLDFDGDHYLFTFTMHGVKIGRKEAYKCQGVMDGKVVPRTLPQESLNQS